NGKLNGYSTIQQTNDSITSAVSSKADRSQVTQLSDQITSTVTGLTNESLITTQMMKDTTLVHPSFNTMPMVEVPVTNGETYTVSTNQPWEANAAHLFFIRLTSTQPVSSINGVYDGKSITLPALSDKIYIVFRNQNFLNRFINGQYWVRVSKTVIGQSQITQLSDMINLRVLKGDVASQINIEAGRTLIDTKQLLLNANTVKFSGSAFIPDAMIQNLTASKINVGTLNGANVNIINLNASNITGGTLNAIDINGANITSKGYDFTLNQKNGAITWIRNSTNLEFLKISSKLLGTTGYTAFEFDEEGEFSISSKNQNGDRLSRFMNFSVLDNYGMVATSDVDRIDIKGHDLSNQTIETYRLNVNKGYFNYKIEKSGIKFYLSEGANATPFVFLGADKYNYMLDSGNAQIRANITTILGNFSVTGSKNAIHATRDGVRATPAYETAESYLGDIGQNHTKENCEIWVKIEQLFSDTVNTDIAYQVFLQAYDDANFWVADFKSDKFLIKSDKPMSRFAWEIKAKRRGYENDRLVLQGDFDNKKIEEAWREK
ncbi:MAG: gp58-like family protein, partial [Lactococcus lactis]|nr:gp58-like family protein [Lactococcus lactis]